MVRGGPWVAVEIRIEREVCDETGDLLGPEVFAAWVDGERRDAGSVWTHLTAISRSDFMALVHARANVPAMAETMVPLDLSTHIMRPLK